MSHGRAHEWQTQKDRHKNVSVGSGQFHPLFLLVLKSTKTVHKK